MNTLQQKPPFSKNSHEFYLSCPAEFEDILKNEIQEVTSKEELQIYDLYMHRGGISLKSDFTNIVKLSLHLRTASKIFWSAYQFKFRQENDLYKKAMNINWSKILTPKLTIKIDTNLDRGAKFQFKNSHFLSLKLKDAIADYFVKNNDQRPSVSLRQPDIQIQNKITYKNNISQAHILVDLFGEPLSNRGYRTPGHEAPLRENLAAAIIQKISPNPDNLIIDSMCGSGTFLIESFLYLNNISPKYLKLESYLQDHNQWSFSKIPSLLKNHQCLKQINNYCKQLILKDINNLKQSQKNQYYGHDISEKSIRMATETLIKAKLNEYIKIQKIDATRLKPIKDSGTIFCNPPYGERLGEVERLEKLYYDYGENLKKHFTNFDAWIFTSNPELRKKISLRTSQRVKFYNGPLECRLLHYKLY